jgi:DNA repair exonuclease SbcCD ATPase subunit
MARKKKSVRRNSKKKAVKTSKQKDEDAFFVGVRDPVEVRRTILEASREAVHFLQRYERLKKVREEKLALVDQLRADVKELRALVNKLKRSLPKTHMRVKLKKEHKQDLDCSLCGKAFKTPGSLKKHSLTHGAPAAPRVAKPKKATELDKLEDELDEIEKRLGGLG